MNANASEAFAGIDISKNILDIHIRPGEGTLHISYDEAGLEAAYRRLSEVAPTLIVWSRPGVWKPGRLASWPRKNSRLR